MSDESAATPELTSNPPAEETPRARRNSNSRPKKGPKSEPVAAASNEVEAPAAPKFPEFPDSSADEEPAPLRTDWPEPEAPSSGNQGPQEGSKRKRRRKKGKGNQAQNPQPEADAPSAESEPQRQGGQPQRQQPQAPRPKLDPDQLAHFAWKIYLSEVSEEGVALVSDADAKELARRCFRLAEIFLEEQSRRR
jgi:hypothetical protein